MKKLQQNKSKKDKVFIYSCTCHRRDLDAKKISKYLSLNNYQIVNDPKEAEYIIFFTCAFVNKLAERCFKIVKKFQKYDAELIIAGCLPDIEKEELSKVFHGKIIPVKNMEIIDETFKDNKIKFRDIDDENIIWWNYNPVSIYKEPFGLIRNILQKSNLARRIFYNLQEKIIKKILKKK